jgi:hypothetical protein
MKKRESSIDYRNKHFNKAKEQNNLDNQSNRNASQTVDIDELDFVAAVYNGKWYLGKVIAIDDEENEAKINFMEQWETACTFIIPGTDESCDETD